MAMIFSKIAYGRFGEKTAASYLKKKGYRIVKRNYRYGHCETDIICESRTHLLFVEVKCRRQTEGQERFGRPGAAVDREKAAHLRTCACAYLRSHPTEKQPRLDVIEIYLDEAGKLLPGEKGIQHIENAVLARP